MCGFFFLAGLVAPGSLRRKGARGFVVDRLRRLGVPFAIYFWIVQPCLTAFVDLVIVGRASSYAPSPGPPWFLAWLLIFSGLLALVSDGGRAEPDFLACARPSLVMLCGCGAALGVLQFVEMIFVPGLVFMPITFGSFPLYCAFYAAGVVASRNNWLAAEGASPMSSVGDAGDGSAPSAAPATATAPNGNNGGGRKEGEDAAAGMAAFALAAAVCMGLAYGGGAGGLVSVNSCNEWPLRGDPGLGTLAVLLLLCVCGGAFAAATLVAALDLFRQRFDAHSPLSALVAKHAFAAYLVHPAAVVPLTGAFIVAARARTGNAASFTFPVGVDFADCVGDGAAGMLLAGVVIVSALALPLTLALAIVARRLPVLRDLL